MKCQHVTANSKAEYNEHKAAGNPIFTLKKCAYHGINCPMSIALNIDG
jgi:hypothetical protein